MYFHPIIVRDNTNGIAFSCTIINANSEKIETLDDLKAAMESFGEEYGNLIVNGSLCGKQLLCYYFQVVDGKKEYRFRYFDTEENKLVSAPEIEFVPDYMSDGVNEIEESFM